MTPPPKKALIFVTSHHELGSTGIKTGFYYDEMATPYWKFRDAGYIVDIASIKGGAAPVDPSSLDEVNRSPAVQRFLDDKESVSKITATLPLSSIIPAQYSIFFLSGGHGVMWDFADSKPLGSLISQGYAQGSIIGSVCHGAAGLLQALKEDGTPLVKGKALNSFTNAEETAIKLDTVVPFFLETRLRSLGAVFEGAPNFQAIAVTDQKLVTGQNPASSEMVADAILQVACTC